jgi:hypothetical protein
LSELAASLDWPWLDANKWAPDKKVLAPVTAKVLDLRKFLRERKFIFMLLSHLLVKRQFSIATS